MDVFGLLGFLLAAGLGLLKLWETFWQRSKLSLDFEWQYRAAEPNQPYELRLYVSNTGRRRDTVRELGLARQAKYENVRVPGSIRRELPKPLEVGTVVRFALGLHPNHEVPIHRALHAGLISGEYGWAYLRDVRRKVLWFRIPTRQLDERVDESL